VTLAPGAGDTVAGWDWTSIGDTGPVDITQDGSPFRTGTRTLGASYVLGTSTSPVPEPATLAAALVGALALVGYVWRRRTAC
jgi:hypothetical protein